MSHFQKNGYLEVPRKSLWNRIVPKTASLISLVPMAKALTAKIERKRKWKQAPVAQRRGFLCLNDNRSTMKNARSHWVCSTALSPFRKRLPHYHTVMRGFSAVLNRSLVRVSFCCTFIVVIWDLKEKKNRARVCYIKEKCKIHRSKKVVKSRVWINIRSFMGIVNHISSTGRYM